MDKIRVKNCKVIKLPIIQDGKDGCLSVAESFHNIPFKIKRVYYIYNINNKNAIRGMHAHKKLQQVIFCINGSFFLRLNDGTKKQDIILDEPNIGIYIGVELWHTMKRFSEDCILLVFASDFYDESDYIRNYSQFIKYLEHKNDFI